MVMLDAFAVTPATGFAGRYHTNVGQSSRCKSCTYYSQSDKKSGRLRNLPLPDALADWQL